jgi:hypothetical protein
LRQVPPLRHGLRVHSSTSRLQSSPPKPTHLQMGPASPSSQAPPLRQGLGLQKRPNSHRRPLSRCGHWHSKSPRAAATQRPPCRHGFDAHGSRSISQLTPVNRAWHTHAYDAPVSLHVPPLTHGCEPHTPAATSTWEDNREFWSKQI